MWLKELRKRLKHSIIKNLESEGTIRLGTLFAVIKRKSVDDLHRVALGMLLYGKSESSWSAPHVKAQ